MARPAPAASEAIAAGERLRVRIKGRSPVIREPISLEATIRVVEARGQVSESFPNLHPAAGGDDVADGGHPAGRAGGSRAVARFGFAGSGLSDHSGDHVL